MNTKLLILTAIFHSTLFGFSGVSIQTLNIREQPSLNSNKVDVLLKNHQVEILEKVYTKNDGTWYKVNNGFISAELININSDKMVIKKSIKDTKMIKNYFIGLGIGYSKMTVDKVDKTGSITLANQPDTKGMNYNIELGYRYNKQYFSTISYSVVKYDDVKLYNYLASYNKVFTDVQYSPYIGIVGGMSYIELTKSHINSNLPDQKGRKFAIGFQTGFEKKIEKNLVFFTQYQFLKAKHKTSLELDPAKSELIRDNHHNLSFGARWSFII